MATVEFMISELQREPRKVLEHLERGDIILKRRGQAALRLTVEGRDAERDAAYAAMVRLVRNLVVHGQAGVEEAMIDAFPWSGFLSDHERTVFGAELSSMLVATAELETTAPLAQLVVEWRATAAVRADPALAARLATAIDEPRGEPVPMPGG
jgi:hypothetical protein